MIGAILGDICGSTYEFNGKKNPAVPLFPPCSSFTDDSIMTIATAHAILMGIGYREAYVAFGKRYPCPMGQYGMRFAQWLREPDPQPYQSWGNGSAMRVTPVGWAFDSLDAVLEEAKKSAVVSHDHPEGIKGAQAAAAAIWLARNGKTKAEIRDHVQREFGYDLTRTSAQIREVYKFNESCQGTVPEAIVAFLDSNDFEDAIRIAISLGGDADTLACITGGIAEAFYSGVPDFMQQRAEEILDPWLMETVRGFRAKFVK